MRLSQVENQGIVDALTPYVGGAEAELRLFGSRTQSHLKGGDIDLLLLIPDAKLRDELTKRKHDLLSEIQRRIGEQKIDLVLSCREEAAREPFLASVLPRSVILKKW